MKTTSAKYRVLGENDDASECSCCGRQGLRRVVWMQALDENGEEDGVPVPFGRVCAARAAGWGHTDRSSIDRRIAKELAATHKLLSVAVSERMGQLVRDGYVVQTRVAYGFDWKNGTHSYGYIYTLPGDPIARIVDPVYQQAEIKAAKGRRNKRYPIFRATDERLTIEDMRSLLAS